MIYVKIVADFFRILRSGEDISMHKFRTHTCNDLEIKNVGQTVKLSGWVHRKRDHGGLIFIDLRDHFGITQLVFSDNNPIFSIAEHVRLESVITVIGQVIKRSEEAINPELVTGKIELMVNEIIIENPSKVLPFAVAEEDNSPEELRLKYRFLDLRREKNHKNLVKRSNIISFLRKQMEGHNFLELQTPILTASSPEGARDFLVPSRKHAGKFYALPQAPQIFKQLLMTSSFDRYFQIAPCFRDEDARADRTPGEFYQLDFEMAFATQEDIFAVLEDIMYKTFKEFGEGKTVTTTPFPQIPYKTSMLKYGSDKPDLRNPIEIVDVTEAFKNSEFSLFANLIKNGACVRAMKAENTSTSPRSFFDKLNDWAKQEGQDGLGYIIFDKDGSCKGPIAGKLKAAELDMIKQAVGAKDGDSVFFVCGKNLKTVKFSGLVRNKIGEELNLFEKNTFKFCFIVDFPMYEINEDTKKIDFSHNPFSMPQGGLQALENTPPLEILAYQYDVVCNGIELSSGAIRNHQPDLMIKAFEIAGYKAEDIKKNFAGLFNAFHYGAPPHGGSAPGVDRMVMLLTDSINIREIIAFPLTQNGEDIMMNAPNYASARQLKELHIKMDLPEIKTDLSVLEGSSKVIQPTNLIK
ncbi:Aspartate--tRNA ligase [Candidatus Hepatincolaceae symbiont of Richtersius coronifer]